MSQPGLGGRATIAVLWRGVDLAGTRVISLLRFLILARLLGPEDFGLLAIAAAALELLSTVTEIGVARALVQRADPSARDLDVGWTIGLLRALAVTLVLVVAAPHLAGMLGDERATSLLRVLALQPVLAALESIAVTQLLRTLRFSALAALDVGAAVVEAVAAIALARSLGVWALVTATLLSSGIRAVLSYRIAPHRPHIVLERAVASSLMQFGKWVFAASLLDAASDTVLRAVIGRRLGVEELGLFYVSARLALLPISVLSSLVTPVAFSIHAEVRAVQARATRAFSTVVSGMVVVLAPVTGVLVALAGPLADDVLGRSWEGAGPVLALLAIDGFMTIPVEASEPMLEGRGRPDRVVLLRGLRAVSIVALASWLSGWLGLTGAALAALAAEAPVAVAALVFTRSLWWPARTQLVLLLGAAIAAALVAGATALALEHLVPTTAGLGLGALFGTASGWMTLILLDQRLGLQLDATVRALRNAAVRR